MLLPKPHGISSFFKYVTASTGVKVLTHQSLRASAPHPFNDCFDVPRDLIPDVSEQEISAASAKFLANLVRNPPDDISGFNPLVQLMLNAVKSQSSVQRDELAREAFEEAPAGLDDVPEGLKLMREKWRLTVPELRIVCFSLDPLNESMWDRYADKHQGVVLEFNCNSPTVWWQAAREVTYPPIDPLLYSAEGWAQLLAMQEKAALKEILDSATLTKTPNWMTEKEWRVVTFKDPNEQGLYSDLKFNASSLSSIYLGNLISAPSREQFLSLADNFPHIKVYEVLPPKNRRLQVTQIR